MASKIFDYLSTISCIITVILLYSFIIISDSFYINGCTILMFLLMLLNPIANICRLNKKIINNPIFHILIVTFTSYISYVLINSIIMYKNILNETLDKLLAINKSVLFFYDNFIYILISTIFILLITILFKKNNVKSNKDNSKIMLLIILITSLVPILTHSSLHLISASFDIALFIFSIILFFKIKQINTTNELRSYYLILIVCSLVSINPIALVLSIYMFLQLDIFGLHV